MSSNWSALHAQLVRSVNRHSVLTTFSTFLPPNKHFAEFRDPGQLLGWLHARGGHPEAKNAVLARLLDKACGDAAGNELAVKLLVLALWPGLCTIRHRLRPFSPTGTLEADLVTHLTIGIRSAKPERIGRVAATLLRNLERDLRCAYLRDADVRIPTTGSEGIDAVPAEDEQDRPEVIAAAAAAVLGEDGVLLTAVHIGGLTQKEAGERLGISHAAARKRCQRALRRLKEMDGR